jgi:hypothetical protein
MQFLQDHLAAIIVSTVVVFILVGVQFAGQEGAIDAVRFEAGRTSTDALGEFIAQDLANVGAGVAPGDASIHYVTGSAPTTLLEFSGAIAPSAGAPVERVRYRLTTADSTDVYVGARLHRLPGYRLHRELFAAGTWQPAGGSPATLVDFRVELLDAAGTPVGGAFATAAVARVRFVAASPLNGGRRAGVTRWERHIPLYNLGA